MSEDFGKPTPVVIDSKDLEQDARHYAFEKEVAQQINELRQKLTEESQKRESDRAAKGKVDPRALASFGSVMGLLFTVGSIALGNWFYRISEPTRQEVALHTNRLERMKGDIEVVKLQSSGSDDQFRRIAEEVMKPLIANIDRMERELEKQDIDIAENEEKVNSTLDEEVIDQRFGATDSRIDSIIGRFERVTEVRLTNQIEDNKAALEELQQWRLRELARQRDQSPLTVSEQ